MNDLSIIEKRLPDATDIVESIRQGKQTSSDIVQAHIERCNRHNPRINAIAEQLFDDALMLAENPVEGPLCGLPITLKETIAVKGRDITAGSQRMNPIKCEEDAEVVKRLRNAGAIVLARSTVPEFVMAGETNGLKWGTTNNPIDITRTAGGSTGGEAALIGSGASPAGIGTDILGSIRNPSSFCGIVGFRPASNLVEKTGVWSSGVGFFETWNGIGPMARSVRDVRLIYNVIANTKLPGKKGIKGLKLLSPSNLNFQSQDVQINAALNYSISILRLYGMGEGRIDFAEYPSLLKNVNALVTSVATPTWRKWLSNDRVGQFSLFNESVKQALRVPTIDPALYAWFIMELLYKKPEKQLRRIIDEYEQARIHSYDELGSDGIVILPTSGLLAPKHGQMNMVKFRPKKKPLITPLVLINSLNLSAITVPAFRFRDNRTGLVPGITLASAPGNEGALLDVAEVLEKAFDAFP